MLPDICSDTCFDLEAAKLIAESKSPHIERGNQDSGICILHLGGFTTYTQEALEFLAEHPPAERICGVEIGFQSLTPDSARVIAQLDTEVIEICALDKLDADVAAALVFEKETARAMSIFVRHPLDLKTAEVLLLARQSDDIYLSLPSLGAEVAEVLRRHTLHSCLTIRNEPLSRKTAELLAHHSGYSLWIALDSEPSPAVLQALSSNPAMPLVDIGSPDRGGYLYCVSLPEFVPRVTGTAQL